MKACLVFEMTTSLSDPESCSPKWSKGAVGWGPGSLILIFKLNVFYLSDFLGVRRARLEDLHLLVDVGGVEPFGSIEPVTSIYVLLPVAGKNTKLLLSCYFTME